MNENNPARRNASIRRIVEITDEDETILIAFVPVGAQVILFTNQPKKKETLQ
jgi:hypothetical protein